MKSPNNIKLLRNALPFWLSLSTLPVIIFAAYMGGLWLFISILHGWVLMGAWDAFSGVDNDNPDTDVSDENLFWYRLITIIWFPIQFVMIYGLIYFVVQSDYAVWEMLLLMFSAGILSGSIGIVYAHELMHQKPKFERQLADLLMAMALYGHFRSEHLLVHHRYVATPRDPVTARYNEGFHRFFPRVVVSCFKSAWGAEKAMLARKGLSPFHRSNPFLKYMTLQAFFLLVALWIGGWLGVGLFLVQAYSAIAQLELVNYVEHYGLTREHLSDGKYEHCKPHHSWNSAHKVTNYFLINLQRHSDHHYKPDRRFPLLQTYGEDEAPQLPLGYPAMTAMATFPPLWRHRMNPRVRAWRKQFYPEITDWEDYNNATNPMPR